ncbi:eisosome protein SEG2-like protein [Tanacetum coccineum]
MLPLSLFRICLGFGYGRREYGTDFINAFGRVLVVLDDAVSERMVESENHSPRQPPQGLSTNGFDKDEIVRVLAGQLSTVAAMADSANIEQLNIQEERHVNEPESDVPSVVSPNFLEVHTTECLNMSFGGFGEVEDQHVDLYGVLKLGDGEGIIKMTGRVQLICELCLDTYTTTAYSALQKRHCIEKHAPCKDDCPLGVASNSMPDGMLKQTSGTLKSVQANGQVYYPADTGAWPQWHAVYLECCFATAFTTLVPLICQKPTIQDILSVDVSLDLSIQEKPSNSVQESREKTEVPPLRLKRRKKVTFDTNVTTYEPPIQVYDSTESLLEKNEKGETFPKSESDTNYRYGNCLESDDEFEDFDHEDYDFDEDDYDLDDEDDDDGYGDVEEVLDPSTESNRNARDENGYILSILNPVENLDQWKALKSKGTTKPLSVNLQKENLPQEKNQTQETAVDASLSNWLISSEKNARNNKRIACYNTQIHQTITT